MIFKILKICKILFKIITLYNLSFNISMKKSHRNITSHKKIDFKNAI